VKKEGGEIVAEALLGRAPRPAPPQKPRESG